MQRTNPRPPIIPTGSFLFPSPSLYINGFQPPTISFLLPSPKGNCMETLLAVGRGQECWGGHCKAQDNPLPYRIICLNYQQCCCGETASPVPGVPSVVNDTRAKLLWSAGGLASYKCKNLLSWRSKATWDKLILIFKCVFFKLHEYICSMRTTMSMSTFGQEQTCSKSKLDLLIWL